MHYACADQLTGLGSLSVPLFSHISSFDTPPRTMHPICLCILVLLAKCKCFRGIRYIVKQKNNRTLNIRLSTGDCNSNDKYGFKALSH